MFRRIKWLVVTPMRIYNIYIVWYWYGTPLTVTFSRCGSCDLMLVAEFYSIKFTNFMCLTSAFTIPRMTFIKTLDLNDRSFVHSTLFYRIWKLCCCERAVSLSYQIHKVLLFHTFRGTTPPHSSLRCFASHFHRVVLLQGQDNLARSNESNH